MQFVCTSILTVIISVIDCAQPLTVIPIKLQPFGCNQAVIGRIYLQCIPQSFKCQYCGKCFSRKDTRKDHLQTFHNVKKSASFSCSICGEKCVNKSRLKQHFQKHLEEKDKECPLCHKAYTHMQSYYKCKSRCLAKIEANASKNDWKVYTQVWKSNIR